MGILHNLKLSGTKQKVKWSTSNKSVAAVNRSGLVTAKKAGSATITAAVGGKKFTCKVKISNAGGIRGSVTYTDSSHGGKKADTGSRVLLITTNGKAKGLEMTAWTKAAQEKFEKYGIYFTEVDRNGHYSFTDIPEGEYLILIISDATTSKIDAEHYAEYKASIEMSLTASLSSSATGTFSKAVGLSNCEIAIVNVKENSQTIHSYDFGISYN